MITKTRTTALNIFEKLSVLNIDVILIYMTISVIMMHSFKLMPSRGFALLLANTAFIIASYTLNVIADHTEDSINERGALKLSKPGVLVLCSLLFALFIGVYTNIGGAPFGAAALIMSIASVWYSFPRGHRLKNVFLLKNIVPSLCWAFTLLALFYLAGGMYFYTFMQVVPGFVPFFLLFFAFEIMWDLPDRKGDAESGVRTLPTMIGFRASRYVIALLFVGVTFYIPTLLDKGATAILILFVLFVPERSKKIVYHSFLTILMILAWIGYLLVVPYYHQVSNQTQTISRNAPAIRSM